MRYLLALLVWAFCAFFALDKNAFAQISVKVCITDTSGRNCIPVSQTAPFPVTGSFTSAAFAPTPAYATPISVSSVSSSVSLPSGGTAVLYNTGSVAAFCKPGTGATTATTSNDQVAPGGFFTYTVGAFDTVACITASSTTTINVSGGTGTPSGSGGGGGSGGGNVTIVQGGNTATVTAGGALSVNPIGVAKNALYGSQTGAIGMAYVETTAAARTNGNLDFASMDLLGNTRVIAGGYDSGAIVATATPANSSHAAGTSVGGLFSIALARVNGGSGILTNIGYKSTGASVGQLVVRIWQKNPTGTTCTDNSAFSGSDTDDAFLIAPPFAITPAAPAVTTGDANSYAALQGITWDYKNVDTSPGQNLYLCAVTVATDTADQNKLVRWTLSGPQN